VNATESLDMDIGGDLNVESLQDSDYAKGSNWGVNASFGVGYGENAKGEDQSGNRNGGAGFNVGSSNHDSAWVNNQTSLTGGTVNINVGGKTTLTGAEIAAGNYDDNGNFVDNGQLEFATNELEYKDLQDFNTSNERGFGISTSLGGSTDKGKASLAPQGSTTLSAKSTGSDAEQTTRATIGMGNITVGGESNPELAGLNRDVDNAQEVTRDMITGALDASVTVDNRIIAGIGQLVTDATGITGPEYAKDEKGNMILGDDGQPIRTDRNAIMGIVDDQLNVGKNAIIAGVGAYGTVEGAARFVADVVDTERQYDKDGNDITASAVDKWEANQKAMATGIGRGGNDEAQELIKKLDEGTATPEEIDRLAKMTSDGSKNLIYSDTSEVTVELDANGNVVIVARSGKNDLENNQGYVNVGNGSATDAGHFLFTDAEERAHNKVGADENAAKNAAQNELSYYNTVAGWTGGYTVTPGQSSGGFGTTKQADWNKNNSQNSLLLENNKKAAAVTGSEADGVVRILPSLYYMAKDGVGYTEATEKVAAEMPTINSLDKASTQLLVLPVELLDSLTSNGMISSILGVGADGLVYAVGEDNATFILDVSEGVAIKKGLQGVSAKPKVDFNNPSTYINWKDVKAVQKTPEPIAKPNEITNINVDQIRYTQTSAGRGKIDLYNDIKNNGYNSNYPIDVVKTDSGFVTIDNTRPAIMKDLNRTEIPAVVHSPSDKIPSSMDGRFGNATTWGEAVEYRTSKQVPELPTSGTSKPPKLLLEKPSKQGNTND
jgi:hypothetical protein